MKPTTIREEKDSIIVESPILSLKLDTNRIIYAQASYLGDSSFKRVNDLPKDIRKAAHKRVFLYQLHQDMQEKIMADPNLTEKQEGNVREQKEMDENNSVEINIEEQQQKEHQDK